MSGGPSTLMHAATAHERAAQALPDVDDLLHRVSVTTARLQIAIRAGYLRRPLHLGTELVPLDAGTWRAGGPPAVVTTVAA